MSSLWARATAREMGPIEGVPDHRRHIRGPRAHRARGTRPAPRNPRRPQQPGWYESLHGGKRFWDGERWTNHWRNRRGSVRRRNRRRRLARKGGVIVFAMAGAALVVSLFVTAGPSDRVGPDRQTIPGLQLDDESPRIGRLGEPLLLSPSDGGLMFTPTRVLDPLALPFDTRPEGSAESRYVGLELRATNLGQATHDLTPGDLSLITSRGNRAIRVDPANAGGWCKHRPGRDLIRIDPASTKTACYAFEVEAGERLTDMRIVLGEAVGVWSLH